MRKVKVRGREAGGGCTNGDVEDAVRLVITFEHVQQIELLLRSRFICLSIIFVALLLYNKELKNVVTQKVCKE